MTTEEKQEIISAVLSAVRTNSKKISQLTPVTEMSDDDYIELSGGRRVAYSVLMSVLEYYVTAEAMTEAMGQTAQLDEDSVLDWKQSPIVLLESMGADYDDIDGGTFGFNYNSDSVPVGTRFYAPHSGYQIFVKTATGTIGHLAKEGVCYVNKHTRRFYTWDGTDMVEFGNNKHSKVIIDDMNNSDLNDIAYNQVVYAPLTKKLIVKVGDRKWWSWSPSIDQLYCDKVNNTTLRWDPSTETFVTIGGGGGMSKAVYDAIKTNIETLRVNFNQLAGALANLAFKSANPQLNVGAFTWPSQGSDSGGDTPVVVPQLLSPTNGSSVNVGVNTGNGVTMAISVRGANLTMPLNVGVTGTGFSVSPTSISAANANYGTNINVTYNGSATGGATGTLTISSDEVTVHVSLTASYQEQGGGDTPTPSEITAGRPEFKVGAAISNTSSGANLVFDDSSERSTHCCTTEYIDLTGDWHRIVIHHDFASNNNAALKCLVLCRYRNRATGVVGYTSTSYANVWDNRNDYNSIPANKEVTVKRLSAALDLSTPTGDYEVTGIAFGVRKDSTYDRPSSGAYAKMYANEGDTQPVLTIFDGSDTSSYDIES